MVELKHPEIPLTHPIPEGKLHAGHKFVVKGEVLDHADRFSINFIHNATQQKIFHLDFRFNMDTVVRNSNYPSGTWGEEERSDNPLHKGQTFKVEIKALADRFHVELNGDHHLCDYHHRAPLGSADAFNIRGDVKIKSVKIKEHD